MMEKYDNYKDSGIEWIGEIPKHWEVKRLKRLARIGNGQDHKNVWDENGEYPIIGTGGVFGKANNYLYGGPSVILGRKGTIDKPQFIEYPFWSVDTAYYTKINKNVNPKLFYYLCTTINFELYKYGSAVPSMTQEVLNQIPFVIPNSLEEQTIIATYLDRKTAEIDELIADKKRLLELYEEEKNAVINQAVTKGINPDVPMKDSGIEWLGDIPEDWEVKRLKYVTTKIGDGIHTTPSYLQGTEFYFINGVNLNNGEITLTEKTLSVPFEEYVKYKNDLKLGSILISLNGTIGKLAFYNNEKVILGKSAAYIELKDLVFNKFIYYILKSQFINNYFEDSFSGTTIKNLSLYTLRNTPFPYLELKEQQQIVAHIETETARINAKKEKAEKLINLLTEYREALISEVVTGKVKVR